MKGDFFGLPTQFLENEHLKLEFLSEAGPRLVRLFLHGSDENQFVEIPETKIDTPSGVLALHGGHRLWHAPEAFPRTYMPDNDGLAVEKTASGVRLTGAVEAGTGIRKTMDIQLRPDRPGLTLRHSLQNLGQWPVELAPWALTQLPLGGTAVLPQQVGPLDRDGLLPNRQVALWPYTRLDDKRLHLRDDFILIQARPQIPPLKVGYLNRTGWVGYLRHGVFLIKRFDPGGAFCNLAATPGYCNDEFIELGTLAPLAAERSRQPPPYGDLGILYRSKRSREYG
jgi:hypothetical protein